VNKTTGRGETSLDGHGDYGSCCVLFDDIAVVVCYWLIVA
jgi:hypothetical protein